MRRGEERKGRDEANVEGDEDDGDDEGNDEGVGEAKGGREVGHEGADLEEEMGGRGD